MMRIPLLLLSLCGLVTLGAQEAPQATPPTNQELEELWSRKDFARAARRLEAFQTTPAALEMKPVELAGYHYALACAYARLGRGSEALAILGVAVGEGFRDAAQLKVDEDLASLHQDPAFQRFLDDLSSRTHLGILQRFGAYGSETGPTLPFVTQAMDAPELVRLRTTCHLEEVVGKGDDVSRVLNLLHWVHTQVRHDGNSTNPYPATALNILEVCRKEGRGVNCRMMATLLNEACLSLGYPSRHVTCMPLDKDDPDCHVINAVWVERVRKWLFLDPTFDATFSDPEGNLLSVPEVRERLVTGKPLAPSKGANWNGQIKPPQEYLDYMAKNLVELTCPLVSACGYESWRGPHSYVDLAPSALTHLANHSGPTTRDPARFWAPPAAPVAIAPPESANQEVPAR